MVKIVGEVAELFEFNNKFMLSSTLRFQGNYFPTNGN